MKICSCLVDEIIKIAQEDWLEKIVEHTTPGGERRNVKVKSLSPEEQEKYRPKKVSDEEIEEKKKSMGKPKTREERQFQFILPQLWKTHSDNVSQFSHKVKDKMKNLGLSFTKDKKWLEPLLEHITDSKWQTSKADFAYASKDKIEKIAEKVIRESFVD